jgi:hypothetical protein
MRRAAGGDVPSDEELERLLLSQWTGRKPPSKSKEEEEEEEQSREARKAGRKAEAAPTVASRSSAASSVKHINSRYANLVDEGGDSEDDYQDEEEDMRDCIKVFDSFGRLAAVYTPNEFQALRAARKI